LPCSSRVAIYGQLLSVSLDRRFICFGSVASRHPGLASSSGIADKPNIIRD